MGVEPILETIRGAIDRAKRVVALPDLQLLEIRATFIKSLSSLRQGFIYIDALDEFPTKPLPRVIRECSNTHLFITRRPHIRGEMGIFPAIPCPTSDSAHEGGY